MKKPAIRDTTKAFSRDVGKALRRSAAQARKVARRFGTPIYVERNGKIVAIRP
jgi:hypothetical protein